MILWVILHSPTQSFDKWIIFCIGPMVLVWQMHQRWGHPKYWWAEFWGISISFERSFRQSGLDYESFRKQLDEWLEITKPGLFVQQPGHSFLFLRKKNAAIFKLAWG
jgi:hypothetical protein